MRRAGAIVLRTLASFRLACVLFVLLLVVVLIGTLEQQHMSLYEVQSTYFASFAFVYPVGGAVPLPFPGGALLLAILAANVIVGGALRMRWSLRTSGVVVVHLGILLLLAGGLVEHLLSTKGFIHLTQGASDDRFRSYEEWEVAIVRRGARPVEWVVHESDLERAGGGDRLRVVAPDLPFDVLLSGYTRNTDVRWTERPDAGIDGVELVATSSQTLDGDGNNPGLLATIVEKGGVVVGRGFLRGDDRAYAWSTRVGDATVDVALRRRSFPMPFATRLERAVGTEHPGTSMPREYSSYVTVTEGGLSRDAHITMNEPLRLRGMILYQSGFLAADRSPTDRAETTLAVVHNPSDRVPLVGCIVIFLGMAVHFIWRLVAHIGAESRRRARRPASTAGPTSAASARSPA